MLSVSRNAKFSMILCCLHLKMLIFPGFLRCLRLRILDFPGCLRCLHLNIRVSVLSAPQILDFPVVLFAPKNA